MFNSSALMGSQWEPVLAAGPCCSIVLSHGWMRRRAAALCLRYAVFQNILPTDRQTGRHAHCSLGVSIDPANHFIHCLINATSHLFLAADRSACGWVLVGLEACDDGRRRKMSETWRATDIGARRPFTYPPPTHGHIAGISAVKAARPPAWLTFDGGQEAEGVRCLNFESAD